MPTFIKTGFWDKKAKAPKEWLDLDVLISQNAPSSSIATLGTSLYSTNPLAGPGFSTLYGIFLGINAGNAASNASYSNFIGIEAGYQATNANNSNFFGDNAGALALNASNSNFIGAFAGYQATNASNSNFFGREAGMNSTGNNVNAFGFQAHKGGTLSGQTVFANATLPSYANRAAATTAITVALGAVAGNTYLYYNQTTFAIEGVRL